MGDAPERIWAWRNIHGDVWTGEWSDEQDADTPVDAPQYIRADIAERDLAEARASHTRLHAGLSTLVHCQSMLSRADMREAAAGLLREAGLKPMDLGGDQSPFVKRALSAEAERDRLAASRDGYAKAEKARAEEQYRLAAQCDIYRRGLETLACTFYKGDQHQDYARHILDTAARALADGGVE